MLNASAHAPGETPAPLCSAQDDTLWGTHLVLATILSSILFVISPRDKVTLVQGPISSFPWLENGDSS